MHTQRVFAVVNSSRCTLRTPPHVKLCPAVSGYCVTGPSLEGKCPVGTTQDRDEPCLPKLSADPLKTGHGRTRLRYQTVLPIWPGYQHQWRACCPHGDGLTQSGEQDFPIYYPRFVLPSESLIFEHTHLTGGSWFHRSCTEVLGTPA